MRPRQCVLPLAIALPGEHVRVHAVRGSDGEAQRLRELGMCEGRTVRVVCAADPMICQVGECRFGLCRKMARRILVERVEAA